MVDVPTSSEAGDEAEQGNQPTSLGDVAKAGQDPVVSVEGDVPDPEATQTREG